MRTQEERERAQDSPTPEEQGSATRWFLAVAEGDHEVARDGIDDNRPG